MGDGYGPMLVAKENFRGAGRAKKIAVPGTMTSAFLALQLWLGKPAREFNYVVVRLIKSLKRFVPAGRGGLIITKGS